MRFYDVDNALHEAIVAADKPVRLKIEIELNGYFESVSEQDIVEAKFFGLKEAAGGTTARGEVLLRGRNEKLVMRNGVGKEVRVYFSVGDGFPYFLRFRFYIDEKGIQVIRGPGRKRHISLGLRDLSYKLRKTDETRDWTSVAVFAYSVVCDKTQPDKSLVHGIAQRAGLSAADIDCSTIPVRLPYVRLRRNVWAELSSLATAYRCHLECPVEKPIVFAHSPYQLSEKGEERREECEDEAYLIKGEDVFYLREMARGDYYRNTVRLKVNMPVSLEKQEIWRYDDAPVFFDEFLQAHYPFKYPIFREIENGNYEAKYHIKDINGKVRNVIYADEIDSKDEAESRLEYDGGRFSFKQYDVTTNYDKAILTLQKEADGDLYRASIFGRPIVLDLNRSCFIRDVEAVEKYGTLALNVTGSYFSEHEIIRDRVSIAQYEDWVIRELAERLKNRQEYTIKTHRALFNARVGAKVQITMRNEELTGKINAFSFRYKKNEAFVASFRLTESGGNDAE